jgi:hypothetical protein
MQGLRIGEDAPFYRGKCPTRRWHLGHGPYRLRQNAGFASKQAREAIRGSQRLFITLALSVSGTVENRALEKTELQIQQKNEAKKGPGPEGPTPRLPFPGA